MHLYQFASDSSCIPDHHGGSIHTNGYQNQMAFKQKQSQKLTHPHKAALYIHTNTTHERNEKPTEKGKS